MPRFKVGRTAGRRRSAVRLIRELPNLLKLLLNLLRDPRVTRLDRILFAAVMTYVMLPMDLLPDFMGFLGLADDLYLVGLALHRLFSQAGPDILLQHWQGHPRALGYLIESVEEIGALLPEKIRTVLKGFV